MSTLSAAIFVTQQRADGDAGSLITHALLHEGSKPFWEIFSGGQAQTFIPDPAHLLEDGFGMLETFIREPNKQLPTNPDGNAPLEIDSLLQETELNQFRSSLIERLEKPGYAYKLVCWPNTHHLDAESFRENLTKAGIRLN
jgi:hypothetical protein